MTVDRRSRVRMCIALATLVPLSQAGATDSVEAGRERGLSRFEFARGAQSAIPQFVKAPAADAPADVAPLVLDELSTPPVAVCFSADNPPSFEIQAAVNRYMMALRDRYQIANRWSGGGDNTPRALTWSFVPDGVTIPATGSLGDAAAPSNLFAQMDAKFGGIANRAVWIAQFQACFNRWAALTGTSYTFVSVAGQQFDDGSTFPSGTSTATRGDIRIGMKPVDGASNVLAYNFFPDTGDMVLDSAENWASGAPNYVFLFNTLTHEHGHGLGLSHNCPAVGAVLMEPFLNTGFTGPQQDDLRAIARSYGDAYESNNTPATATAIGNLSNGVTLNPSTVPAPGIANGSLTAISVDGDQDHYVPNAANPVLATVTVTPLGSNYQSYTQNTNGTCNTGAANTNALNQADLTINIVNADGAVLRSVNATVAGGAESLTGVLFSGTSVFVRVGENGAPTQTQMYTLAVTGTGTTSISATDATLPDRVEVTWTAVTGAATYQVLRNTTNNLATATVIGTPAGFSFNDTTAVPGTTYFYWVNALFVGNPIFLAGPDQGSRQVTGPANDLCANAVAVTSGSTTNGTLVGATNDGAGLGSCGSAGNSPDVWYAFTAPACDGVLTVNTCGTHDLGGANAGFDSVVSIIGACGGTEILCGDDSSSSSCPGAVSPFRDSFVTTNLTAGQSVRIRVATFNNTVGGPFILNVNFAPANDLCADAAPVFANVATPFCNISANTDGPTEAACLFFGNNNITNDLWYAYTPVGNGRFTVSLCSSGFDTKVGIYGSSCPASPDTIIACNDDACGTSGTRSQVSAIGTAGTTYRIRVGGYNGATGNGSLTVFCAADFNQSGAVTVQDIFDFLAAYFANSPSADINGVAGITVQDIFDFLATYFGGC